MTKLHIAADHAGYELAREFERRAREAGHDIAWQGADAVDPGDDYPAIAVRLGQAVVADQDAGIDAFGIMVVDEGEAGAVAVNKVNGARAVVAPSVGKAQRLRRTVDANVLAFDGVAFPESAWNVVNAFIRTPMIEHDVDSGRRVLQIEEFENSGTIEGWAIQLQPEQQLRSAR